MASGETAAHRNLKRLALTWAQTEGYSAVATEIRLPNSAYRADVVAYKPASRSDAAMQRAKTDGKPNIGVTAVFECKQARSDFLKDSYPRDTTAMRLKQLDERRRTLERLLKLHYPSLRSGETLFADYDSVDVRGFEHKTYRKVLREIGVLQRRLFGKTKFERLVRYRCANLNYLVVEQGIIESYEVPLGWGVLVHRKGELVLEQKPAWQDIPDGGRLALLQRIAIAGTRKLNREFEIKLA